MALTIVQQPLFQFLCVGQNIVYTIASQNTVLNESNVKFLCSIWGGKSLANWSVLATLKTSPNAAGVGIFDIGTIIESYAKPTYQGRRGTDIDHPNNFSTFKQVPYTNSKPHAIHLIDRFCTNRHNMHTYLVDFGIEFLNTATGNIEKDWSQTAFINENFVFNGVLSNTNPLTSSDPTGNGVQNYIGYNPQDFNYEDGSGDYIIRGTAGSAEGGRFVTNMPVKQKIRENDYGTVAFFNLLKVESPKNSGFYDIETMPDWAYPGLDNWVPGIALEFFDVTGAIVQSNWYENTHVNGGAEHPIHIDVATNLVYFGHGLANMKGRNQTWPASAVSYDVFASEDNEGEGFRPLSRRYNFEIISDDCHNFESVRLTWLNRMGTWDYYTFTKKNVHKWKTKGVTYSQLGGTWNEQFWNPYDHLGGDKIFINKTKESVDLNTDYIDQETAAWLEELFTSSDVYIIHQWNDDEPQLAFSYANYIHKYIEGVTVGSKSYTKKTTANDGLIKYKFKVNKSKPTNIQRA